MKYLTFIARAPSFEDEDKNLSAALLHFILVATTLANLAAIIARPILLAGETLGPISANIIILLVQIGLFVLMWNRRVRLSGFMLAVFLWLILSLGAYTNAGILNPVFGAQTVVIVIAGLLINEWAALAFAFFSSAFGLWLVQIAAAGKYITAMGTITTHQTWTNDTTAFVLTGLLLFLSLRTIREARRRAVGQARIRRHSDERYRALVENAPDSIFTLDRNHRITFLSRSLLHPMEMVMGHSVYEFLGSDAHDAYRAAVNRVLELGSTEQIEVQNLQPNEQSGWYAIRFAPIWDEGKVVEVTAISTDISERKKAEEALRESEEQYRQLFEDNPHPMFVSDAETRQMLAVNDAALAKYGYSRDEFVGLKTVQLLHPDDYLGATERLERSKQENLPFIPSTINRFMTKDGSIISVEAAAHQLDYQGHKAILTVAYDLTERLKAEEALRENEARLRARIESAMDAIITIDSNQEIVQFNPAAEKMFRVTADEIIGEPIVTLIPQRFRDVHGGHIRAFGHTGVTNRHMGALGSISGLRADGEEFPIEASISQFDVGTGKYFSVILRDITKRVQAEAEIRRSEELFSTIFQSVPVAIGIVSLTTGRTLQVNDYMLKLTGFDADEIVGKPVPKAPYWEKPDQWQKFVQAIELGQPASGIEMEWRTQAGQNLTMLGSALPVDLHGEPCILGLALDITERKHAERTRLEMYKERELLEVKERFISKMSHEFRTPLAVIMFTNELMRLYYDRMTPEQRAEHFQNVSDQVQYVTEMLDEVLILSKERAGKMPFNPLPMNLNRFCEKLFEQVQATDNARHEFIFLADHNVSEIQGDEKLLQHIFINLLSNAIKYTPEGGEVCFEVRGSDEGAVVQVRDQGIGIPIEDQIHLFEPFYRASNTHTIEGTGLGLAIVKESVELHQGTITCESAPGHGTIFQIYLPVAPVLSP